MRLIDLTGQRFGRLTVLCRVANQKKKVMWQCSCDCGNLSVVSTGHLRNGHTRSCGCLRAETMSETFTTHHMAGTPLYGMWCNMKNRCNNPNSDHYQFYGSRGIKVCDEWVNSFEAFYAWATENGYEDGLSIERKDVNQGYYPSNCCFIPVELQALNRQNTRRVLHNGEVLPVVSLARQSGIKRATLIDRLNKGLSVDEAIEKPLYYRTKKDGEINAT